MVQGYPQLRVYRLPHHLFPSGMEYFHKGRHKDTALVVHANYLQGQDVKRKKLQVAGLWATKPDLMLRPEQENLKPVAETVP